MPFPISLMLTKKFRSEDNRGEGIDELYNAFQQRLSEASPRKIERTPEKLEFWGGPLRLVGRTNLLLTVDRGWISLLPGNSSIVFTCALRFSYSVVVFLLVCLVAAVILLVNRTIDSPQEFLYVMLGLWMFFFSFNYLLTWIRFDLLVNRVAAEGGYLRLS